MRRCLLVVILLMHRAHAEAPAGEPGALVVINSTPTGARIYDGDRARPPIGVTPWRGSLTAGNHEITLVHHRMKDHVMALDVAPGRATVVDVHMSRPHYLCLSGVEVRTNVPGADVYLDDRSKGAVARTPAFVQLDFEPHMLIIAKPGYREVIVPAEDGQGKIEVTLEPVPPPAAPPRSSGGGGAGTVVLGAGLIAVAGATVAASQAVDEPGLVVAAFAPATAGLVLVIVGIDKLASHGRSTALAPVIGRGLFGVVLGGTL